jgi:hypothetical protein
MDLKALLGDLFKDNMTIDEINAAIANKNYVDADGLPKSVAKDVFDKTASDLAKAKKELAELKNSSLTAEEKIQQALNDAATSKTQYEKELCKLKAKELFVGAGLTDKDYTSVLDIVVSDNEENTVTKTQAMINLISAQKAATEKAVKADLLKNTPKPPAGSGAQVTFDEAIQKARDNGDMVTVAALIRQQAEQQSKTT